MAHEVFICYSSEDKLVDASACASLEAHYIPCWIAPRDVALGDAWDEAIMNGLETITYDIDC
jgi:hypothetical protein